MERAQGFAMQGSRVVWTSGLSSTTVVQESAPLATITVYLTGTTELATLYSDNQVPPTSMANPFTANYNGYWFFYAADGRYDVMIESPEWTWTIGDLLLQDGGRWTADQNANGHWLRNLGGISFVNNVNPMCASPQIFMDQFCNLQITGPQGLELLTLTPQGNMKIAGCLTTQCIHLSDGACAATISFDSQCNILFSGPIRVPSILLSNGLCQSTITFDAGCRVEITGPGLSVDGYLNVVGGAQIDGPFAINGGLSADIDASGRDIRNVGKLETAGLEFNNGTCQAEIQFDANCNLVFSGNVKMNNDLTVAGNFNAASISSGGSGPLNVAGQLCAASYCINGTEATGGPIPGYVVINGDGQFVGHGVWVGKYGMEAAYLQLDGTNLPPDSTVLSVFGPSGSTGAVRIHGHVVVDQGMYASVFGVYQFNLEGGPGPPAILGVPGPATFTTADGKTATVLQGLIISLT